MKSIPLRVDFPLSAKHLERVWQTPVPDSFKTAEGICLDSRSIQKGDIFFAIKGERDGHDFVKAAFNQGAALCVVDRNLEGASGPTLQVKDTYQALAALARDHRETWGKKIVAISGSNGKTTTKEILSAILGAYRTTFKSPGTWNNFLGVPLCALMLKKEHEFAVFEMGMNHLGELASYCEIAMPNFSLLTNIGYAHIGELGSIENIAQAKGELFAGTTDTLIVNLDDARVVAQAKQSGAKKIYVSTKTHEADIYFRKQTREDAHVEFEVQYGNVTVTLKGPFFAPHMLSNVLCALGAAWVMGVPSENLQAGLDAVEWPSMRLDTHELKNGVTLIDDSYNANPDSMMAGIKYVSERYRGRRKLAALGDMRELGSLAGELHEKVGAYLHACDFEELFFHGEFSEYYKKGALTSGHEIAKIRVFAEKQMLAEEMSKQLLSGDVVLVKGSRGSHMEDVVREVRLKL